MSRPKEQGTLDTPREPATPSTAQVVVGTAGHVDHGKSTLVRALTGIDPDRLKEEKDREMTIDLGFAWIDLPSGQRAAIVDVPGHERFIKNMLAGVGGIDLALLVVAADEGPMPQTREHLAILDLLGIRQGVVALTKTDMADPGVIELAGEEIVGLLDGTGLAGAPIVPVSAATGEGLPQLVAEIDKAVSLAENVHQVGPPRLPVDRVFSMQGFGTVVTGTVIGGELSTGQELVLMPGGLPARIRGIQSHNQKVELATPGNRAAINIAGLTVDQISRGDVLTPPGALEASTRLDCRITMLKSAPDTLEQNDQVDFFCGAAETPAWLTLLDSNGIAPGGEGWVQFRLGSTVAVAKGDRFIIRRPSPSETIGGGVVVDAHPVRHRRFQVETIASLEVLQLGAPEDLVLAALRDAPVQLRALLSRPPAGLDRDGVAAAIGMLIELGKVSPLAPAGDELNEGTFLLAHSSMTELLGDIVTRTETFHKSNPIRRGIPREALRRRIGLEQKAFDAVIESASRQGVVIDDGAFVRLPAFEITLDLESKVNADAFLIALKENPVAPPAPGDFGIGDEVFNALADLGLVVKISDTMAFEPGAYRDMTGKTMRYLDEHGSMTLADYRDLFGTSRKFAQAVLEHFDQRRLTRRVGDTRKRYAQVSAQDDGVR